MYHYIREGREDLPYFRYLHIDDFLTQLDDLSTKHHFVTHNEFQSCLETGDVVENGLILTFDDGLKDHLRVSQELAERGLWGIFYVATGPYENKQLLDVHRIHMLIGAFGGKRVLAFLEKHLDESMLSHNHVEEFHTLTYARQSNDDATEESKRILNYLISYDVRTQILTQMMREFFGNESELTKSYYLNEKDMQNMCDMGMIIGSHSISHPVFSKLTRQKQQHEIQHSFAYLQNVVGAFSMKTFCYPYGGFHSFTDETEQILEEQRCLFSFNVEQRDIESRDILNRPQALPRYDCNQFRYGSASMGLKRPDDMVL